MITVPIDAALTMLGAAVVLTCLFLAARQGPRPPRRLTVDEAVTSLIAAADAVTAAGQIAVQAAARAEAAAAACTAAATPQHPSRYTWTEGGSDA